MGNPQIGVRVPPALMTELNRYVEETGISKTDVVVNALAQYLGKASEVSLSERVSRLEIQMQEHANQIEELRGGYAAGPVV